MHYSKDFLPSSGLVINAITGDGSMERNILEILANKYDGHDKTIYFPKIPEKNPFTRRQGRTGLSILNSIKTITGKYQIENYIYLVDREHVGDYNEIRDYLSDFMNNLTRDENVISGRYGSHDIWIYCSIMGDTRRVEENISELIRIKTGDMVEPDKNNIKIYLRSNQHTDIKKFIKNSSINQLSQAFPDLIRIIELIENL